MARPNDSTTRRAWRWRRCPNCRGVYAAGDYAPVRFGRSWQERGEMFRRCPGCGAVRRTATFKVVKEARVHV